MEKVAILKCPSYEENKVDQLMRQAFEYFGGIDKFVQEGMEVLLKPNLLAAHRKEEAVTTHPQIIASVIKLVLERGAHPVIGDSPAFGSAAGVSRMAGIKDVATRYKVPIVEFGKNIIFPQGICRPKEICSTPQTYKLTKDLTNYDVIINLPKLKVHIQLMFTAAVKNLYGFVSGKAKAWRHLLVQNNIDKFCDMLLEIYQLVKPEFSIVDAVWSMEERGPRGGKVKETGLIFAGTNCLAIDLVIAEVLNLSYSQVPILRRAKERAFSGIELPEIQLVGEKLEQVKLYDFKLPQRLSKISFDLPQVLRSISRHIWTRWIKERRKID